MSRTDPLQVLVNPSARSLSLTMPSDLALVGDAVERVARHCDVGILSPRRLQFNLRTALAEALANAIVYGNQHDASKHVTVEITCRPDGVRIVVADAGAGFDPSHVPDPTAPENIVREDGRGLFVLRQLVDRIEYNEQGNSVCLELRAG